MGGVFKINITIFSLIFFSLVFAYSQSDASVYPLIKKLTFQDPLFKQYTEDVAASRVALAQGKVNEELPIKFYRYKVEAGWDVLGIVARCCIDNAGIITLNRIQTQKDDMEGLYILLPTMPGLYIPEDAGNPLEKLEAAACEKKLTKPLLLNIATQNGVRKVYYFPNDKLDETTWRYFLSPLYRFPLDAGILTSPFGKRPSPFSGKPSYHPGIDLAAPTGSPVYACAPGKVKAVKFSNVYGNHIIIKHNDGNESLYGHLSKTIAHLNQIVKAGTLIGEVGSTGMSTGPHLHFEIRKSGVPTDPQVFIKNIK